MLRFGHEGKLRIAFAAQKPMLYLKISSPDSFGSQTAIVMEESHQQHFKYGTPKWK